MFWLSLPLVALVVWFSCELMTTSVLSRPYSTKDKLQAKTLNIQVGEVELRAVGFNELAARGHPIAH